MGVYRSVDYPPPLTTASGQRRTINNGDGSQKSWWVSLPLSLSLKTLISLGGLGVPDGDLIGGAMGA